jgi:hypothetical protein
VLVQGADDYNAGIYLWSSNILNGKTVYINSVKGRFVGWSLTHWVITSTYYLSGILVAQTSFGGYAANTGSDIMSGWGGVYIITRVLRGRLDAFSLVLSLLTPPSDKFGLDLIDVDLGLSVLFSPTSGMFISCIPQQKSLSHNIKSVLSCDNTKRALSQGRRHVSFVPRGHTHRQQVCFLAPTGIRATREPSALS